MSNQSLLPKRWGALGFVSKQKISSRWDVLRRSLSLWSLSAIVLAVGCAPTANDDSDIQMTMQLKPSPPVVGQADVVLTMVDANGTPIQGATVRLEGNMNHAGMKPSFSDLEEGEAGRYTGKLDFTMGGDWFVLVSATTKDGQRVTKKIDVPGVKAE